MKVLMVLTSHDQLGDTGKPTGFWLEEFAAPYYVFKDAGIEVILSLTQRGPAAYRPKERRTGQPDRGDGTLQGRPAGFPARPRQPITPTAIARCRPRHDPLGTARQSNLKGIIHEAQEHLEGRNGDGSARRPGRRRLRAGQVKYSLKSPSGIAFSDFKGYEDWAVVSSARTDEVLKVIVANPAMIEAYKAGVPGNGQPFPEGSKIVKLQWKPKKSTEAPFDVDVPDVFTQAFVIEKDSKRFPKTGGWGYALFNYDAATGKFTADRGHRRLRALMPCGGEEQGLHLPSVPDAVNAMTMIMPPIATHAIVLG